MPTDASRRDGRLPSAWQGNHPTVCQMHLLINPEVMHTSPVRTFTRCPISGLRLICTRYYHMAGNHSFSFDLVKKSVCSLEHSKVKFPASDRRQWHLREPRNVSSPLTGKTHHHLLEPAVPATDCRRHHDVWGFSNPVPRHSAERSQLPGLLVKPKAYATQA